MSTPVRLPVASLVIGAVVALAACGGGAAPTPGSGSPTPPAPTPTGTPTGIAHPTGATDIVLRFDEAGGFVPPEFLAAHVPIFTLYGDGTVVFVQTTAVMEPRADGVATGQPIRTAKLTEDQVQDLLEYALGDGGLGTAKPQYQNMFVSDAPTATFDLVVEGGKKTVSAYALGMEEPQPTVDTPALKKLRALADRLRDFDKGGSLRSDAYEPTAYRGVLTAQQGLQGVRIQPWPWPDVKPSDFALPEDQNALQQGTRAMTPAEVAALGVDEAANGIAGGVFLRDDAGTLYTFVLRPLLPDERA